MGNTLISNPKEPNKTYTKAEKQALIEKEFNKAKVKFELKIIEVLNNNYGKFLCKYSSGTNFSLFKGLSNVPPWDTTTNYNLFQWINTFAKAMGYLSREGEIKDKELLRQTDTNIKQEEERRAKINELRKKDPIFDKLFSPDIQSKSYQPDLSKLLAYAKNVPNTPVSITESKIVTLPQLDNYIKNIRAALNKIGKNTSLPAKFIIDSIQKYCKRTPSASLGPAPPPEPISQEELKQIKRELLVELDKDKNIKEAKKYAIPATGYRIIHSSELSKTDPLYNLSRPVRLDEGYIRYKPDKSALFGWKSTEQIKNLSGKELEDQLLKNEKANAIEKEFDKLLYVPESSQVAQKPSWNHPELIVNMTKAFQDFRNIKRGGLQKDMLPRFEQYGSSGIYDNFDPAKPVTIQFLQRCRPIVWRQIYNQKYEKAFKDEDSQYDLSNRIIFTTINNPGATLEYYPGISFPTQESIEEFKKKLQGGIHFLRTCNSQTDQTNKAIKKLGDNLRSTNISLTGGKTTRKKHKKRKSRKKLKRKRKKKKYTKIKNKK